MKHITVFLVFILGASPALAQNLSLPLHGNWCGIGHSGQVLSQAPVDALDAACMRHDICTGQRGRLDCGCDLGFMYELRNQAWAYPGIQNKARAVYDTIAIMPCSDPNGMALKTQLVVNDWATGVMSGRESPWDIMRRVGILNTDGFRNGGWGY